MHVNRWWQLRLVNLTFVALFLIAITLLQWISREYHWKFDLTQNNRHTLTAASIAVAQRLTGPIVATVYADRTGDTRRATQELIGRYQAVKTDLNLKFIDPDLEPDRTRDEAVQPGGEIFLEYQEARERLPLLGLNEEALTNALTRLGHRGERWLVFLSGHGERSPDREANFDLSTFGKQLRHQGFKTRTLALAEIAQIPENTTALVIAGPRKRLFPGEIKELRRYLEGGGNLWWLADPGPLHGLESIAEMLGIEFHPGVIVDGASEVLTGDPSALVLARYSNHPTVRNLAQATVFPRAIALTATAPDGWTAAVVLDTAASAWVETGAPPASGPVEMPTFDKSRDIGGPLTLAAAVTRMYEDREQRVLVVGDGDFLSNSTIANVGNLDLGLSLANWLSQIDAFVDIPTTIAHDRSLNLSRSAQITIAGVFLLLLPLMLAASGVVVWWRRRRR